MFRGASILALEGTFDFERPLTAPSGFLSGLRVGFLFRVCSRFHFWATSVGFSLQGLFKVPLWATEGPGLIQGFLEVLLRVPLTTWQVGATGIPRPVQL